MTLFPPPLREALYSKVLPLGLIPGVIHHPTLHLCIMVAQILPPYEDLPDWLLKTCFWGVLVR